MTAWPYQVYTQPPYAANISPLLRVDTLNLP